jgi:hypothetical protein
MFILIFHLDNGDMKGMKAKDIIGHECKFFNIDYSSLYNQIFCYKVWVLSKVLVVM